MENLIVIVGLPGSGKSFASDIIRKRFKARAFNTGDLIRDEIKRRGWKYTPETDARIARWYHSEGREKLLIRRLFDKVRKTNRRLVVLDGLRSVEQLKHLKKCCKKKPVIIYIKASFESRARRELKRRRFGSTETAEYIRFRDQLERSHGIMGLIRKADHTIDNNSLTMPQFRREVIKTVKNIA
ncbi:MAG: AAA family ATPase [Candidatus Aenigmatarchaeota archaeon]